MTKTAQITKEARFDAGHRIPYHGSSCRHIHGHGWLLQVTVEGPISQQDKSPSQGMVMDFGTLKKMMHEHVVDIWDHAFLVWDQDKDMLKALSKMPGDHRTVKFPFVPTCENLVWHAFDILDRAIEHDGHMGTELVVVRLYETPTSYAEACAFTAGESIG